MRLLRCDLLLVNPYWLVPITFLSFTSLEITSKWICSITFLGTEVNLIATESLAIFEEVWHLPFLQSSETFHDCHDFLKMVQNHPTMTSASTFKTLGCILSGHMDLCMSSWLYIFPIHSLVYLGFKNFYDFMVLPNILMMSHFND